MADLSSAMTALGHQDFNSLPEDLKSFMKDEFAKAEIILNSVPLPPPHDSPPPSKSSKKASSAADTLMSYDGLPKIGVDAALQKEWGKPQKIKDDNPLNVSVYKMSGHDKGGAWFARRSVHQGIGFEKLHEAMASEFDVSLAVKDGPGSGAVRGIAGDNKLEEKEVEGIGKLEGTL